MNYQPQQSFCSAFKIWESKGKGWPLFCIIQFLWERVDKFSGLSLDIKVRVSTNSLPAMSNWAGGYSHGQGEQMWQTGFLNHLEKNCDFKQQVWFKQLQSCSIRISCSMFRKILVFQNKLIINFMFQSFCVENISIKNKTFPKLSSS